MTLPATPQERSRWLRHALQQLAAAAPSEAGRPTSPLSFASVEGEERGYVACLHDLLVLLGAVAPSDKGAQIVSPQGGYLIEMLLDLLPLSASLVADWVREGVSEQPAHPFGSAVDLLAALEQRRQEMRPDPRPLRCITAAVGVCVRQGDEGPHYLVVWDAAARSWQLVGGRYELRDRSPRATLLRELSEELGLPPLHEGSDVVLEEIGTVTAPPRRSPSYGLLTSTTFHLYSVRFLTTQPPPRLDVRWVREDELLAGATTDGQTIAAAPLLLLREQRAILSDDR